MTDKIKFTLNQLVTMTPDELSRVHQDVVAAICSAVADATVESIIVSTQCSPYQVFHLCCVLHRLGCGCSPLPGDGNRPGVQL